MENNEIMNNEAMENIMETGTTSGLKKGAVTVAAIGLTAGLGYVVLKLGKKLITAVKARKSKKLESVHDCDDSTRVDDNDDEE